MGHVCWTKSTQALTNAGTASDTRINIDGTIIDTTVAPLNNFGAHLPPRLSLHSCPGQTQLPTYFITSCAVEANAAQVSDSFMSAELTGRANCALPTQTATASETAKRWATLAVCRAAATPSAISGLRFCISSEIVCDRHLADRMATGVGRRQFVRSRPNHLLHDHCRRRSCFDKPDHDGGQGLPYVRRKPARAIGAPLPPTKFHRHEPQEPQASGTTGTTKMNVRRSVGE